MTPEIKTLDRASWQDRAREFRDYNYRQAWEFGLASALRRGARCEHLAVVRGGEVLGLAGVRVKGIPMVGTGIAYLNGGPLVRRNVPDDPDRLRACLAALDDHFVRTRGFGLRVHPPPASDDWNATQSTVFAEQGFQTATMVKPYRTFLLDLAPPPEAIRRNFVHQWRTNLNHAERNDLEIVVGQGRELFESFSLLYTGLTARKQFRADLTPDFYARVQDRLNEPDRFIIFLALAGGRPVAGYVVSALGDTWILLLGAGNDQGLTTRASYRLQWEMIRQARDRGFRWYDLGGIDAEANPGVYRFKKGLGGRDVTAPGPFERLPDGIRQYMSVGGERLYRFVQRVRTGCG